MAKSHTIILSKQERRVMLLWGLGYNRKQIMYTLTLREGTVRGLMSRAEAKGWPTLKMDVVKIIEKNTLLW